MTAGSGRQRVLLDTNVVVWMLLGERDSITGDAQMALENPKHELLLSAVSVWEIAIKRSIGKIDIECSWARELFRLDLVHLPVTAEHARCVEDLPWHHRDPFDRLLIAQAMTERCCLVTADPRLRSYGVSLIW